jgi:hypothetical protein
MEETVSGTKLSISISASSRQLLLANNWMNVGGTWKVHNQ